MMLALIRIALHSCVMQMVIYPDLLPSSWRAVRWDSRVREVLRNQETKYSSLNMYLWNSMLEQKDQTLEQVPSVS